MKLRDLEFYFFAVIRNQRNGFFPAMLRTLLLPLSWIFRWIVACRNFAFDNGWLSRYFPPVPLVISVGNIVVGGTGKTPVALMLAKEFYSDFSLAILSRGYRSKVENLPSPVWLSRGEGPIYPASFCGDEPFLLAQNLPKALIFVGRDRHKASIMAAKAGAEIILLDDGMQHRRLARDLEVIVMDARDLFGQSHFLPRGFLREDIKSLARAHLIILNNLDECHDFASQKELISHYSTAPIIGTRLKVNAFFDFDGYRIETLKEKRVGIFCGIAHPDYFEQTVENEKAHILGKHIISDHQTFDQQELHRFALNCQKSGAEMLICTEKDRVRFGDSLKLPLPVAWIQMQLAIVEGASDWAEFIAQAKKEVLQKR